jgi:hypothetical protein
MKMTVRFTKGGHKSGKLQCERRRNSKLGVSSSRDIGNPDGDHIITDFRLAVSEATPEARHRAHGFGRNNPLNLYRPFVSISESSGRTY